MLGDHIRALKGDRWLHGIDLGDQRVLFLDEAPGLPPADRLRRVYRPEFTAGAGRVETVVHREPAYPAKAVVARAWSRFMDPSALAAVTTSQQFAEWCKVGRAPAVVASPAQPQPAPAAPAPVAASGTRGEAGRAAGPEGRPGGPGGREGRKPAAAQGQGRWPEGEGLRRGEGQGAEGGRDAGKAARARRRPDQLREEGPRQKAVEAGRSEGGLEEGRPPKKQGPPVAGPRSALLLGGEGLPGRTLGPRGSAWARRPRPAERLLSWGEGPRSSLLGGEGASAPPGSSPVLRPHVARGPQVFHDGHAEGAGQRPPPAPASTAGRAAAPPAGRGGGGRPGAGEAASRNEARSRRGWRNPSAALCTGPRASRPRASTGAVAGAGACSPV